MLAILRCEAPALLKFGDSHVYTLCQRMTEFGLVIVNTYREEVRV